MGFDGRNEDMEDTSERHYQIVIRDLCLADDEEGA